MAPWGPLLKLIVQFLKELIAVYRKKNHFPIRKNPLLVFIPKEMNPVQNLEFRFFEISFNFILASTSSLFYMSFTTKHPCEYIPYLIEPL